MKTVQQITQEQEKFVQVNRGVLPDPLDHRDYDAEEIMGSNLDVIIDWVKGYDALQDSWPDMPNKNQGGTNLCVSEATTHYKQVLQALDTGEKTELSPRSIAQPYLQPGLGMYIRDGMMRTVNYGVNKESTVPTPDTDQAVIAPLNFDPYALEASFYKNLTVASISTQDFKKLAQMIYVNHGFVSGWGNHCQYFKGYGTYQGKIYLKTHGSYGPGSDMMYFEGQSNLFSAWTAVDIKNIEVQPVKNVLNFDLRQGDNNAEVLKLRQALTTLGWVVPLTGPYDSNLSATVYNFQKANLSHLSWAYIQATWWYHGTLVDQDTRQVINQDLSNK